MAGSFFRTKSLWVIIGLVILFLFPVFLDRFYIYLAAIILLTGLCATSLNFVLGYGGVFQFHHAVFYGVGAYSAALMVLKSGLSPWLGFIVGPSVAAILGFIIGLICVRLSKLYFGMLQISLGSLVWAIVYRWYSFTGGDDGIHGIPLPDIISSPNGAYYFTLIVTSVSMFILYRMIKSPFGSALQGIRDNPVRSEMIGVNVRQQQLLALTIAGFFGGVAGSLFVVVDNTVFPDMMFWTVSLELVIMCLLGGWLSFLGPIVGAAIIVILRTYVSGVTVYWALVLGIIMMLVIFFLPNGVLGYLDRFMKKKVRAR
ncbi:MAG: branched-chain amino acid ABC transporter permease [Syntrophorhabdaceae bacterium]|nr:branched-chain amino acid ABC transporter permease [Syntrophorhabdaceae bacterium]MDD4195114.1 branched-chain amino acid ABC transporter permease [Syntrophorhabdaceae bacterium]HOC45895.1 branched-chain amino acid ABC transporter permease [Syntrophorhabdaceae bacterium]